MDRRKTGSKHQLICDGKGTTLHIITTAANVNDIARVRAALHSPQSWSQPRSSVCARLSSIVNLAQWPNSSR
ncbi:MULTISPECIES: hypothetical protein [unclassified Streptomyces]|uniref:hypothetical protein n=1 Tax=unclassified Streptomyces TaxID=2593676 RepID=UPI00099EFB7E